MSLNQERYECIVTVFVLLRVWVSLTWLDAKCNKKMCNSDCDVAGWQFTSIFLKKFWGCMKPWLGFTRMFLWMKGSLSAECNFLTSFLLMLPHIPPAMLVMAGDSPWNSTKGGEEVLLPRQKFFCIIRNTLANRVPHSIWVLEIESEKSETKKAGSFVNKYTAFCL